MKKTKFYIMMAGYKAKQVNGYFEHFAGVFIDIGTPARLDIRDRAPLEVSCVRVPQFQADKDTVCRWKDTEL